ncbi:copper resistance CopC family protein [Actinoplanes derwentensis]|uniref:CopC domain-containing protein n=2 Tax=Actinoplanes derwentensis TaxID=113562 RepID=A0A1H2BLQ8_9ACTN|nr:copper resistance CopC family protein [Actinoplanes derwentensis]SDT58972.1 hypothetical protein SAMN04489716_4708 [Actinoplanes derwentensis]
MLFVLVPGAPAWAHNALAEASPDKKATLKQSPSEVKLRFLQKLDPEYTVIAVSDAAKQKVATSDPKVDGATSVVTFDGPLANGVYTVAYQVVSTDGHTVKGSYEFTVADPSAIASPTPSPEASTEPTTVAPTTSAPAVAEKSVESDDSGSTVIGVIVGIVVAVAAVAGFLFVKRRKA